MKIQILKIWFKIYIFVPTICDVDINALSKIGTVILTDCPVEIVND